MVKLNVKYAIIITLIAIKILIIHINIAIVAKLNEVKVYK